MSFAEASLWKETSPRYTESNPSLGAVCPKDAPQSPLISVIMPTFNLHRYTADALESVYRQTYPHWELLVVDDGSTDHTLSVVRRWHARRQNDPRVKVISTPYNVGIAGARNTALRLAEGQYIAFLDADDLYEPDALEKLLTALQQHPQWDMVHGHYTTIDSANYPLERDQSVVVPANGGGWQWNERFIPNSVHKIVTESFIHFFSATLMRRSVLETVGLQNETLPPAEDFEYFCRMLLFHGQTLGYLPTPVYRYRIHTASATKDPRRLQNNIQRCRLVRRWLFAHPQLPSEALGYESESYARMYGYWGRERLLDGNPELTLNVMAQAWQDPQVKAKDWLAHCLPLTIRACLPAALEFNLRSERRQAFWNRLHWVGSGLRALERWLQTLLSTPATPSLQKA
ncbi:MAG: glycosyltransferase [Candidatus Melainabacteria bacterium]|nr:glycosyltransferase [Candidatus Melainabacteria bacterium]